MPPEKTKSESASLQRSAQEEEPIDQSKKESEEEQHSSLDFSRNDSEGYSITIRAGIFVLSFSVFLILWQILASQANDPLIVAGPVPVFQALINLVGDNIPRAAEGIQQPDAAILQTFEVILIGFGLGAAIGIPLGIVSGRWRFAEGIVDPWVNATYSIPIVALIPVTYYAIGSSFLADIFIAFLLSVFTIVINTQNGVKYVSRTLSDVGKSLGASEYQSLSKVILPASLPDVLTGLRIGAGRAILGAVLAEALLSENGLGGIVMTFQALYDTPYMMATVVLIALLGIVVLELPKILEKQFFRWKESERISRDFEN